MNGSKGAVGESNANLFCSMLILLIQRALHQIQRVEAEERVQAALVIDEAHNVFIPAFSTLLAEGRSGGIEVAAAFQYTGQIADESVQGRGQKPPAERLDLSPARLPGRAGRRGAGDGSLPGQHPRRRRGPAPNPNRPNRHRAAAQLPRREPVAGERRSRSPRPPRAPQPMEELVATPAAREARAHHEREQLLRGDHPHDHGRYIQPPLVWSASDADRRSISDGPYRPAGVDGMSAA